MGSNVDPLWQFFLLMITAIVWFFLGRYKSFREAKHKAYTELLPPITKMVYQVENQNDIKEFNTALIKLWLYANSNVAKKMDEVLDIIHGHGNFNERTEKLQEVIMLMRKDLQFWSGKRLRQKDINHIYTYVTNASMKNPSYRSSHRCAHSGLCCCRPKRKSKLSGRD